MCRVFLDPKAHPLQNLRSSPWGSCGDTPTPGGLLPSQSQPAPQRQTLTHPRHGHTPRQGCWAHRRPPPAPPEWPRPPRAWPFLHHQIQCPAVVGCKGLAPGPSQPKAVGRFFLAAPGSLPRLSQLHHSSASAFTHPSLPPRPLACQPFSTYSGSQTPISLPTGNPSCAQPQGAAALIRGPQQGTLDAPKFSGTKVPCGPLLNTELLPPPLPPPVSCRNFS